MIFYYRLMVFWLLLIISMPATTQADVCVSSFVEFVNSDNGTNTTHLPSSPWRTIAELPIAFYRSNAMELPAQVEILRATESGNEIWVRTDKDFWAVFHENDQLWEMIPFYTDAGHYISKLFITTDGQLWGQINVNQELLLVPFNDSSREFQISPHMITFPLAILDSQILLDENDNFWVLASNQGIFQYDATSNQWVEKLSLSDIHIQNAVWSSEYHRLFFTTASNLYQFNPDTQELVPLATDDLSFSFGLAVRHNGEVWVSHIGYWSPTSNWTRTGFTNDYYAPYLMFESSDGMLWYVKWSDSSPHYQGSAWYDPETGEGCMFTNFAGTILEDSHQRLWMIVNNTLYLYDLAETAP